MVCSITLLPANPINASGSASIISPSIAKLAVTPPVVGSVSTHTYNNLSSSNFANAALTLAICIKDNIPSCILAPPDTVNIITGNFNSIALSIALVIFSPTTDPILPIMNLLSIIHTTTSIPAILPFPVVTASLKFVFSFICSIFSL